MNANFCVTYVCHSSISFIAPSFVLILTEARDFCELPHTESDMDILNVEMATEEDFRTYPNYIFLRGKLNGADELADFIHENFDLEILDILHEDDSDSYIVIFDPETCAGKIKT